jgi:hypothetical protein
MKTLHLAQIGGQLFAVDKECVLGVGMYKADSPRPIEQDGRRYLPLPNGHRVAICDVRALMTGYDAEAIAKPRGYYLIIAHGKQAMALPMSGKGRIVTADIAAALPLPSACAGQSRALISGVLANGDDLILLLNPQSVLEATAARGLGAGR